MAKPTANKKTAQEVKREVAQRLEEIEFLKEQARERGLAFSSLDEKELERKVRGESAKSPYIYAQAWNSTASPGSTVSYTVYVSNPDAWAHFPFYVTIFFGLGNFYDVDEAWTGRDERWPAMSSDRTYLAAGAGSSFSFTYTVPTGFPTGTYNGNAVLWEGAWHDVGASFDRGSFDVKTV